MTNLSTAPTQASTLSHERLGIYLPIPRNGSFENVPIEELSPAQWRQLAADQPEAGWRWAERLARLAAGQLQQMLLAEADLRKIRDLLHARHARGNDGEEKTVTVADAAGEIGLEIDADQDDEAG